MADTLRSLGWTIVAASVAWFYISTLDIEWQGDIIWFGLLALWCVAALGVTCGIAGIIDYRADSALKR